MKKDCVFCKIISGEIPAKFVYKDKDIAAFKDINPVAPTHILIVPVKHVECLSKTTDKDILTLGKILITAKKLAEKMKLESFRVLTANGENAGQTVKHMHFHLIGGGKNWLPSKWKAVKEV
jgi:histidine triad (HIT) family protein